MTLHWLLFTTTHATRRKESNGKLWIIWLRSTKDRPTCLHTVEPVRYWHVTDVRIMINDVRLCWSSGSWRLNAGWRVPLIEPSPVVVAAPNPQSRRSVGRTANKSQLCENTSQRTLGSFPRKVRKLFCDWRTDVIYGITLAYSLIPVEWMCRPSLGRSNFHVMWLSHQ